MRKRSIQSKMLFMSCLICSLSAAGFSVSSLFFAPVLESVLAQNFNYDPHDAALTSKAASVNSVLSCISSIVFLFVAPLLGAISDVYGRKPVFIFLSASTVVQSIGLFVGYYFLEFWWLVGAKVFGFSLLGIFSVSFAYVTDISSNKNKAQRFAYLMGSFGAGTAILPTPLGYLGNISTFYPLLLGVAVPIMMLVLSLFVKESLRFDVYADTYNTDATKKMPPLRDLLNPLKAMAPILRAKGCPEVRNFLLWIAVMYALFFIADSDIISVGVLYNMYRYGWTSVNIAINSSIGGSCQIVIQFVIIHWIIKYLGKRTGVKLAMFLSIISHSLMGFATQGWMIYALAPVSAFGIIAVPLFKALVSDLVPRGEQGAALGALYSVTSIASLIGSLISSNIFAYFISPHAIRVIPGAPFFLSSIFFACLLGVATVTFAIYSEKRMGALEKDILPIVTVKGSVNNNEEDNKVPDGASVNTAEEDKAADGATEVVNEKTRLLAKE